MREKGNVKTERSQRSEKAIDPEDRYGKSAQCIVDVACKIFPLCTPFEQAHINTYKLTSIQEQSQILKQNKQTAFALCIHIQDSINIYLATHWGNMYAYAYPIQIDAICAPFDNERFASLVSKFYSDYVFRIVCNLT